MDIRIRLFLTAVCQVTFVSMNVIFISKAMIIPMLLTGFMISFMWTLNVKKVAFGDWWDRVIYATGAMIGTGLGYLISTWMSNAL
jgi:hypothetical protein